MIEASNITVDMPPKFERQIKKFKNVYELIELYELTQYFNKISEINGRYGSFVGSQPIHEGIASFVFKIPHTKNCVTFTEYKVEILIDNFNIVDILMKETYTMSKDELTPSETDLMFYIFATDDIFNRIKELQTFAMLTG